ncbi:MAG: hypothetical protein JXA20_20220 [Spirochaetes bacterium]|nr:hypothetical protein [Spirochaetota bacterium]
MQNLKYHLMNIASMIIFALVTSFTINQAIRYSISPAYGSEYSKTKRFSIPAQAKDFDYYQPIAESGFFKIATLGAVGNGAEGETVNSVGDLMLLGTISGPRSIARALIQKKGDPNPRIFALYRVSGDINNDVYGFRLTKILRSKIYLKGEGNQIVLDVFSKYDPESQQAVPLGPRGGQIVSKTLSKSELQQKISKNMDNALKGIAAKPNNVNGVIDGYYMVRVPPYNLLYSLGIRSGDIIKRINNHPIDSTQKLLQLWDTLMNESKIRVDIERRSQIMTLDFTISD